MTTTQYVIRNEDDGMMLAAISIKRINGCMCQERAWTLHMNEALHFEVCEEAEAVINFISDVIDWELAQQLKTELITRSMGLYPREED